MKHLDLFSGIGGFALAADWAWPGIEHTFCEIDPFCQRILKKHWPESKIYGDIRTLRFDTYSNSDRCTGGCEEINTTKGWEQTQHDASRCSARLGIDLLTGGFPCQPFSQAGRRRGTEDDRYLWPEMLRVIREFHPRWVIGENVGGFVTWNEGMVLEQVHSDLEGEGYEVQAFIIPAVAVNAPHRRDRVWIVAHTSDARAGCKNGKIANKERRTRESGTTSLRQTYGEIGASGIGTADSDAPDTASERSGTRRPECAGQQRKTAPIGRDSWNQNWIEVATRLCGVDARISAGLDLALRRVEEIYGTPYQRDNGKGMRTVRKALSSPEIREAFGRLYEIPDTEVLLEAMRGIPERGYKEWADATCDPLQEKFLRDLWEQRESGCAPHRWEHRKQQSKEHHDVMPHTPHEASLAVAEAWHCVRFSQQASEAEGYKIKGSRNARLKALGNSIVPQVAAEIMKAIKAVDER